MKEKRQNDYVKFTFEQTLSKESLKDIINFYIKEKMTIEMNKTFGIDNIIYSNFMVKYDDKKNKGTFTLSGEALTTDNF